MKAQLVNSFEIPPALLREIQSRLKYIQELEENPQILFSNASEAHQYLLEKEYQFTAFLEGVACALDLKIHYKPLTFSVHILDQHYRVLEVITQAGIHQDSKGNQSITTRVSGKMLTTRKQQNISHY